MYRPNYKLNFRNHDFTTFHKNSFHIQGRLYSACRGVRNSWLVDAVIFNSANVVRLADSARQAALWQHSKDKVTKKIWNLEKKNTISL